MLYLYNKKNKNVVYWTILLTVLGHEAEPDLIQPIHCSRVKLLETVWVIWMASPRGNSLSADFLQILIELFFKHPCSGECKVSSSLFFIYFYLNIHCRSLSGDCYSGMNGSHCSVRYIIHTLIECQGGLYVLENAHTHTIGDSWEIWNIFSHESWLFGEHKP